MGAARSDHDSGIVWLDVGPMHRQASELARVVVEVDAVLAPRLPAINQSKRTSLQRMEGMRDPKGLCRIARRWCNRLLRRTRTRNGSSDQRDASVSIMSSCSASWDSNG